MGQGLATTFAQVAVDIFGVAIEKYEKVHDYFLYTQQEIATAVQHSAALIVIVVNNASYGNVKRDQERLYEGRHSGAVLHNPDFQAYARSFGVPAWMVVTADAFRGALREALASDSPAVIEVVSDITKDYPPYKFHSPRMG